MANAFARFLANISIDDEPHVSILDSLHSNLLDGEVASWHMVSADEAAHLRDCPRCALIFGGLGKSCVGPCGIADGVHVGPEEDLS